MLSQEINAVIASPRVRAVCGPRINSAKQSRAVKALPIGIASLRCAPRNDVRSARDFAGVGFEQFPGGGAGLLAPAGVERAERGAEAVGVRRVDGHAATRQFLGAGGVDRLGVVALQ